MANRVNRWTVAASALVVAAGFLVPVRGVAEDPRASRDVVVGQSGVWTETDLNVDPGERVVFAATGDASCPGAADRFGPDGLARGFRDLLRILPMPQAGRGAPMRRFRSWSEPRARVSAPLGARCRSASIGRRPIPALPHSACTSMSFLRRRAGGFGHRPGSTRFQVSTLRCSPASRAATPIRRATRVTW